MNRSRTVLVLVLLAATPSLAPAGFIFGKKTAKPEPAVHVPELLGVVKADGDEDKRIAAAEELRQYDTEKFPDIIPVLVDVLLHDSKASVRAEAAQSLGKLRPVSQQAGAALEQAVAKDAAMRVRLQARSSLLLYYMAGYHSGKKDEVPPVTGTGKEPPLAGSVPPPVSTSTVPPSPPPPPPPSTQPAPPRLVPVPNPNSAPPGGGSVWAPYSANKPLPLKPTGPPPLAPVPASGPAPAGPSPQGPDLTPPE
jgi:hypothetical protein